MQLIINILYVSLGLLVVWYIYYLSSNRIQKASAWGREKKIINILIKYKGIRQNHNKKINDMLGELEKFFYYDVVTDYRKMSKVLTKIKNKYEGKSNCEIIPQIDIVCEIINRKHKYIHVSPENAQLFEELENALEKSSIEDAKKYMGLIYAKSVTIEENLNKRGKIEFGVGTVIGLLGLGLSLIQMLSK